MRHFVEQASVVEATDVNGENRDENREGDDHAENLGRGADRELLSFWAAARRRGVLDDSDLVNWGERDAVDTLMFILKEQKSFRDARLFRRKKWTKQAQEREADSEAEDGVEEESADFAAGRHCSGPLDLDGFSSCEEEVEKEHAYQRFFAALRDEIYTRFWALPGSHTQVRRRRNDDPGSRLARVYGNPNHKNN